MMGTRKVGRPPLDVARPLKKKKTTVPVQDVHYDWFDFWTNNHGPT